MDDAVKCVVCGKLPPEEFRRLDDVIPANLYFLGKKYFCSPYCCLKWWRKQNDDNKLPTNCC